jgi:hypothetical protein
MIALFAALSMAGPVCAFDPGTSQIVHTGEPTPQYEVGAKPWGRSKEVLTINGQTYKPVGSPMDLGFTKLSLLTMQDGVPILKKGTDSAAPARLYLLTSSAACAYQVYVWFESDPAK